ncbi:MAG: hypothetical protein K2H85_06440, partial [Allobaculum sp.]|nr:hypothetical protein [Allobaculum sp.]
MNLKTKVAHLLRKWVDRLDPSLSFDHFIPIQPIRQDSYNVENISIKLTYALPLVALSPDFNTMVREEMAYKITEALMSSQALSIN